MATRAVQISIDTDLLRRVDADADTRRRGRSAVVRSALELYLAAKRRRLIDEQITGAYRTRSGTVAAETADLIDAQQWPDD